MKTNIFLPKKINVGYQERDSTYTGKLAYIIYFDEKGKLRKEVSWNGWREESLGNDIYDNEPTSGFVLNKKTGGYSTGWNHRQTYVRVYDPRGFEFEISVPNLLYILENTNSIKGKGLEGDFVYGWDGKDLLLIPCDSPDYKEISKLNSLLHKKNFVKAKDLKIGATYLKKDNKEHVYMGKFHEYGWNGVKSEKPVFWFYIRNDGRGYFDTMKTISQKFVEVVSEECVEDYADIFDEMEKNRNYSPIDDSKTVYIPYTNEEIRHKFNGVRKWFYVYSDFNGVMEREEISEYNGKFVYYLKIEKEREYGYSWNRRIEKYIHKERVYVDTLEELMDIVKPMKKMEYLANGKFYGEAY
ncbi:hypothetical protein PQE75_gp147 [Bacillus phage vB_BcoS-136]|uniref:Uncharacterized protein n=1 Tax=Bacillus phage vB_BcoS-136 TaxID=2419619 RepID=A0A3G3BVN4_9CAUD|nr:hypothetical protein PQE75_gp147 [Bacillus phage vB_BcoS-136]AYP68332.1 hypothetical protein vBBcoS136_00218 [Bacillus phage vB_BcoS-136]